MIKASSRLVMNKHEALFLRPDSKKFDEVQNETTKLLGKYGLPISF